MLLKKIPFDSFLATTKFSCEETEAAFKFRLLVKRIIKCKPVQKYRRTGSTQRQKTNINFPPRDENKVLIGSWTGRFLFSIKRAFAQSK